MLVSERADMCSGPGSAGRQRDTRCAADILLILPLLFFLPPPLFSVFVLLRFPLLLRRPFKFPLAAQYFSHFTPPRPRSLLARNLIELSDLRFYSLCLLL